MKSKIKTSEEPAFKPVTIEMTFESQAELAAFYARMNAPTRDIESACLSGFPVDSSADIGFPDFRSLENALRGSL